MSPIEPTPLLLLPPLLPLLPPLLLPSQWRVWCWTSSCR